MRKVFPLLLVFFICISIFPLKSVMAHTYSNIPIHVSDAIDDFFSDVPSENKPSVEALNNMYNNYKDTHYLVVAKYFHYSYKEFFGLTYMIPYDKEGFEFKITEQPWNGYIYVYPNVSNMAYANSSHTGEMYSRTESTSPSKYIGVYVTDLTYFQESEVLSPDELPYCRIVMPRDGFKDNVPIFAVKLHYQVTLKPGQTAEDSIFIEVDGGKVGGHRQHIRTDVISDPGDAGGIYSAIAHLEIEMNPGENVISAAVKYVDGLNEYYGRDEKNYYYYLGIVDEDGDGIDDRTEQPIYKEPEDIPIYGPEIPEGSGIFGYITWFFESIFWVLGQASDGVRRMFMFIGSFKDIVAEFFNFLPPEFLTMMFIGVMLSIVLRVIGR